jgi:hypothetical protein
MIYIHLIVARFAKYIIHIRNRAGQGQTEAALALALKVQSRARVHRPCLWTVYLSKRALYSRRKAGLSGWPSHCFSLPALRYDNVIVDSS